MGIEMKLFKPFDQCYWLGPRRYSFWKENELHIHTTYNKSNKKSPTKMVEPLVPAGGIEPPLTCVNWILNPARLPIPPHRPLVAVVKNEGESPKYFCSL